MMRVPATGFQAECPSNSEAKMPPQSSYGPEGDVTPKHRDVSDDERSTTASSLENETNSSDTHHSGSDSEGAPPPRSPAVTSTVKVKDSSSAWAHLRRLLTQLPCNRRASVRALAVDKAKAQVCRRPPSSHKKHVEIPSKLTSKLAGKPPGTKYAQATKKGQAGPGLGSGTPASKAPAHSHVALLAQLEKRAGKTPVPVKCSSDQETNRLRKNVKSLQLPPSFRPPPGLAPPPGLELPHDTDISHFSHDGQRVKREGPALVNGASQEPESQRTPLPMKVNMNMNVQTHMELLAAAPAKPKPEAHAELQAEVPQVTYTVQGFKKEIVLILRDLTMHKNVGQAVQRLRAQNVPKDRQADEFVDILTRVMEERRGPQRRICIAFVAGASKAFGKEECMRGIAAFFTEVYDELLSEIPALNKFVATELLPTLRTVFSKEELDGQLPAGFSTVLGGM